MQNYVRYMLLLCEKVFIYMCLYCKLVTVVILREGNWVEKGQG